jgi:hypothetical protein
METRDAYCLSDSVPFTGNIKSATLSESISMIFIPESVWNELLREFRKRRRRVEQVAFLDGIEIEGVAVVTTLTFPNARLGRSNFAISTEAMSQAGQHLDLLTRIAQIHTHPGPWIGHSEIDDALAYSHHDGAVSIVLPEYGKSVASLSQAAIHMCENGKWRELKGAEREAVRILPSKFDFR